MKIVILTALLVGGATVFGAALGLIFRRTSERFNDAALSVAAGVMLAAAMIGLILPSIEYGGRFGVFVTVFGIFVGALCVNLFDLLLRRAYKPQSLGDADGERVHGVFLFVAAIAMHNLPEGIASGVGFGTDDVDAGILIATAIALQNIPEGMIVLLAMLGINMRPERAFLVAALTGVVEVIGTFLGYFAVSISTAVLPFVLAFAGGNMLYVIADEMIPEVHSDENGHSAAYFILAGFCLMLLINQFL